LVTPFTADGAVDWPALRRVVQHVIDGGVEVLVPLGTTAESVVLSPAEQQQVVETVLEVNAGQRKVLLGCGGNDTRKVAEAQAAFEKAFPQIDGFLSVTPYYNRPTQAGLELHYTTLAQATDKPIVLYNVPPRTGCNMLPETVLKLAHAHRNIVAVKEASGNLEQGMQIVAQQPAHFVTLSGDDILGLSGLAVGFQGVISVVGNVAPRPYSELVRAALAGDYARAQQLHYKLLTLMQANFAEGNPAGVKAALAAIHICEPQVRLPLAGASAALQQRMRELVPAALG
jgi:4-hydroxy-tetrahydrodipicolinate synthase